MGIFDGVLGGQGGMAAQGRVGGVPTSPMEDAYNNHMQQLHEEEELKRQHLAMQANVYSQQLAQSMMNAKQATLMGAYAKQAAIKPFNPNDSAAYTMPMSNLATLWKAKHGDAWVETFDEDFWRDARARMSKAGMFEEAHGWFRIKEDV
jgi:hypothetical protein